MTIRYFALATFLVSSLLLSGLSFAEEGFYLGVRSATVSVDEEEIDDLKDLPFEFDVENAGKGMLIVGYDFGKQVALEFELGTSEHEIDSAVPAFDGEEVTLSTVAMYAVYRSEGKWFFKGKGGLLSRNTEVSFDDGDDSAGVISIGLGGGVNIDERIALEAEYTSVEQGIGSFGLNLLYHFQ